MGLKIGTRHRRARVGELLLKFQLYLFGMVSKRRRLIGSALVTDEREWDGFKTKGRIAIRKPRDTITREL